MATAMLCIVLLMPVYLGNGVDYQAPADATLTVTFEDGSTVLLDHNSVATIYEGWGRRKTELKSGMAFFDVAKNKRKPFVVESGDTTVTVLGTSFSVYHDVGLTEVVVESGKVNVSSEHTADKLLVKNQKLKLQGEKPAKFTKDVNVEQELGWRDGVVYFKDEKLEQIVRRMNRYYEKPIYISDKALSDTRLSGSFAIDNKASFLESLRALERISINETATHTVLY